MTTSNRRLGNYEIIEELGRGNFATVYKAKGMDRLGQLVAIKVLHPELMRDAVFVHRFEREAEIMSRLVHQNIAVILSIGDENGQLYLVMRYVPGMNLRDYVLKVGQLTMDQIASIAQQIGSALDYAHAHNAIHRDVKPGNIIYADDGQATLTDFGIAQASEGTTVLASSGNVVGTPPYVSPEQAQSKPVDWRSDLYSLGVTAYEFCTGEAPYAAENIPALYYKIVHEEPPLPSQVNPRVAEPIEQVLLKGMAKKPADRYQSGAEFSAAFSKAVHDAQGVILQELLDNAKTELGRGNFDTAVVTVQKAIAIAPDNSEAKTLLSVVIKRREWSQEYQEIKASVANLRERALELQQENSGLPDKDGVLWLLTSAKASIFHSRRLNWIWLLTFVIGLVMVIMGVMLYNLINPTFYVNETRLVIYAQITLFIGIILSVISAVVVVVQIARLSRRDRTFSSRLREQNWAWLVTLMAGAVMVVMGVLLNGLIRPRYYVNEYQVATYSGYVFLIGIILSVISVLSMGVQVLRLFRTNRSAPQLTQNHV